MRAILHKWLDFTVRPQISTDGADGESLRQLGGSEKTLPRWQQAPQLGLSAAEKGATRRRDHWEGGGDRTTPASCTYEWRTLGTVPLRGMPAIAGIEDAT